MKRKNLVSILIPFLMDFGTNLHRFWEGFGGQVGPKLVPKWHQNPTTQPNKKIIIFWKASGTLFNEFLVDFGSVLGGPGGTTNVVFGHLLALEAQIHPRALQEPPKSPQEPNFG